MTEQQAQFDADESDLGEEIVSTFIIWNEPGQEYRGVLLSVQDLNIRGTDTYKYSLDTGDEVVVYHGTVLLDALMQRVNVGDRIRLRYVSQLALTNGNTIKQFRLWKLPPAEIE